MWRIDANEIKNKAIRPAPMGTEVHKLPCLVFEDSESSIRFCVVTLKDEILTAKTMRGLKGVTQRAGLIWSENIYMP